jgi:hypothetical protein
MQHEIEGMTAQGIICLRVLAATDEEETAASSEFTFTAPGIEGYVLGRSDVGSSYVPDVDLAPHNAQRFGISRRHAALVRNAGIVHVIDLGSIIVTFFKNKRLSPQIPVPLKEGDQLGLANLSLEITKLTQAG